MGTSRTGNTVVEVMGLRARVHDLEVQLREKSQECGRLQLRLQTLESRRKKSALVAPPNKVHEGFS